MNCCLHYELPWPNRPWHARCNTQPNSLQQPLEPMTIATQIDLFRVCCWNFSSIITGSKLKPLIDFGAEGESLRQDSRQSYRANTTALSGRTQEEQREGAWQGWAAAILSPWRHPTRLHRAWNVLGGRFTMVPVFMASLLSGLSALLRLGTARAFTGQRVSFVFCFIFLALSSMYFYAVWELGCALIKPL